MEAICVFFQGRSGHRSWSSDGSSEVCSSDFFSFRGGLERASPVKDHLPRPIQRDIWKGALKAAAKVERRLGLENLGPWDDFEWGMLNGKLSALRWVLGDEWDMLDT